MVNTPVLFETFVRVEYARQVWDAIKVAQPKKLYFYSNKGRAEKDGEVERNNEIRSWIKEIDWDCELHTWFREECVDVYTSLRSAVSWVFENEESAVILEDDIVPSLEFFSFTDQLIDKFKDDRRVWYVSGDNFWNINPSNKDIIFSSYHWMYGWATWKDRWESIDWNNLKIAEMISEEIPNHLFKTKKQAKSRIRQLVNIKSFVEKTKDWDYVFGCVCDQNGAVGVFPKHHLITNLGLSGENHKKPKKTFVNVEYKGSNNVYIINDTPSFIFPDYEYDYQCSRKISKLNSLYLRVLRRIIRIIK